MSKLSESGTFISHLSEVELINVNVAEDEHWIERIYIDKKSRKPFAMLVYPTGFLHYFIYFDEKTCNELFLETLDSTFHSYGLNWFTYNGISKVDTLHGQQFIQDSLDSSAKLFNYVKSKMS